MASFLMPTFATNGYIPGPSVLPILVLLSALSG